MHNMFAVPSPWHLLLQSFVAYFLLMYWRINLIGHRQSVTYDAHILGNAPSGEFWTG